MAGLFDQLEIAGSGVAAPPPSGGRKRPPAGRPSPRPGPVPAAPVAALPAAAGYDDRDYQIDAESLVLREWGWFRSTLLVMATGTGKTVVSGRIARRVLGGDVGPVRRLGFFAHREELIRQARATFRAAFPTLRVEVEQATEYATREADIVVGSIPSISKPARLEAFPRDHFGGIIIDEAHHAAASNASYKRVIDWFSVAKVLGVTATPDRGDEEALGEVFESVAMTFDILEAVEQGWLVKVGQRLEYCDGIEYENVGVNAAGDFEERSLAEEMQKEKPLYALCEAAIKYSNFNGGKRPTLVFTASKDHAIAVADILNRWDAKRGSGRAAAIHYKTDKALRPELLQMYKRGEIRYLCNFGILTEGFDDDETRVVVIGRPTKVRSLYAQMVGRGTRPLKEILAALAAATTPEERKAIIAASRKPAMMIVDVVGLNHKLILTAADLLGGNASEEAVELAKKRIAAAGRRDGGAVDVDVEIRRAERELAEQKKRERMAGVHARVTLRSEVVDPFDVFNAVTGRESGWDKGKPISDAQRDLLAKFGVRDRELEGMSRSKASRLIDVCMTRMRSGLCSYKVAGILKRNGYDPNLPRDEASRIIEHLKANGWRRIHPS